MPPRLASLLARMLDRQMWCWGRDIRRPAGNLLVELDFLRRSGGGIGPSEYTASRQGHLLRLWGFGLMLVPPAGPALALKRNFPDPLVVDEACARRAPLDRSELGEIGRVATADDRGVLLELLPRLARRLAEYEMQVASMCGETWQVRVQRGWERGNGTVVDMPARWLRLARALEAGLARRHGEDEHWTASHPHLLGDTAHG